MSHSLMYYNPMIAATPSLADLAAASGLEARTIRSWVAQDLLPAPLNRGPAARYPADTLDRVLAIRAMRDVLGMPLAEIRKELLVASPEEIRAHASRVQGPEQQVAFSMRELHPAPPGSSALDYIVALRARVGPNVALPDPRTAQATAPPAQGFEALEHRLGGHLEPARKARAEDWLHILITPDVELTVRAPLDPEQRVRLERCADLIRDILLGRDR
jgi:DNA-binding transcriptional MerR regulator